jgi:lysophospholipase L1-like esterase
MSPSGMNGDWGGERGRVSPRFLTLLLCASSCAVGLLLAEGILRVGGYGNAVEFDYRPEVGWVHTPNQEASTVGRWTVRINSTGFRGPEYRTPKPSGLFRILLAGDSFTFGYGVAEDSTYGAQLERLLSGRPPTCESVQVVNGGVNGYNTEQEVAFVQQLGLQLEPDLVIIGFNPNDIMEAAEGKTMLRYPALKKALGRSAVYQFFVPRLKSVVLRRAGEQYDSTIAKFIAGDPSVADRGERVRRVIDSLADVGKKGDFRLAVAVFPFADQVYGAPMRHWPPEIFDRLEAASGIPVLDLLPAFRAAARQGQDLFLNEPTHHPNPSGLHIVATELHHFLEARGLLPTCPRSLVGAR